MPRVRKDSKKTDVKTTKVKDGPNPRRRKSKGQDEKSPETPKLLLRPGKHEKQTVVIVPEKFDLRKMRQGTKFTFIAPGKSKKCYVCTRMDGEVLFERQDDKHSYTRTLDDVVELIGRLKLECTIIK